MNGYIAFCRGKRCEVHAETTLKARAVAITLFKAALGRGARIKDYEVSVVLAEKDGEPVVHTATE